MHIHLQTVIVTTRVRDTKKAHFLPKTYVDLFSLAISLAVTLHVMLQSSADNIIISSQRRPLDIPIFEL